MTSPSDQTPAQESIACALASLRRADHHLQSAGQSDIRRLVTEARQRLSIASHHLAGSSDAAPAKPSRLWEVTLPVPIAVAGLSWWSLFRAIGDGDGWSILAGLVAVAAATVVGGVWSTRAADSVRRRSVSNG